MALKKINNASPASLLWDKHATMYEKVFEPVTWLWGRDALTLAGYAVNFLSSDDKHSEHISSVAQKTCLDVACGTGQLSITAASMGFDVTASDFSTGMISRLEEKIQATGVPNIRTKAVDGQTLEGIDDHAFDMVISNFGLCLFPDRVGALQSVSRVLRPGGQLILTSWENGSNNFKMIQYILDRAIMKEDSPPAHMPAFGNQNTNRTMDRVTFQEELMENGFIHVKIHPIIHSICVRKGHEFVEALLDNGGIRPAIATRDLDSVKLTILEFCRLTMEGIDPFSISHADHSFIPRDDNRPENHSLWSSSFSIPFKGLVAISEKPNI